MIPANYFLANFFPANFFLATFPLSTLSFATLTVAACTDDTDPAPDSGSMPGDGGTSGGAASDASGGTMAMPADSGSTGTPGDSGSSGGEADTGDDAAQAYCDCIFGACHETYHERWGEDEIVSRMACEAEAAALSVDGIACRMTACQAVASEADCAEAIAPARCE
ncbi:MAG: hypothetical protein AAF721_12795 [Myxococcota bacterium]